MSRPGFPRYGTKNYSYPNLWVPDVGPTISGTNSGSVTTDFRDAIGPNTPGWPRVKGNNPYVTNKVACTDAPIRYEFVAPGIGRASGSDSGLVKATSGAGNPASLVMGYSWPVIIELYDAVQSIVNNRLASNVKNQKVNYAQVWAERDQTARLIASTAKRLAESFLALRRGNFSHAVFALTGSSRPRQRGLSRVAGGVPEQWLALQYGWKPLLSDVYGSAEELAKYNTGSSSPDAAEAFASGSAKSESGFLAFGGGGGEPDYRWKCKASAHGRGSVRYYVDNEVANNSSRTGLINPLQLGWELLPYSFVVDWFLPVGNYLSNLDYQAGLSFKSGWMAVKARLDWTGEPYNTNTHPPGFASGGWSGGSVKAVVDYYGRNPGVGFPSPSFPRLKDPFSPTHVANALSLLATAFSGTHRVR
ncbi:TPA_asm: maturation protein [ssRNA phage Zoerhiza.1_35]|uniref:Maturation protein n=2 Tax=Fiersviridae TaxID=2842319 RepID=A0A8S5L345_9VIRU|nr:maturation protein [ssRNA phage Zoerhiza.1_35]QDH89848.1 MAG: hypothetical protein H1Rhizo27581_000005 [Leviviridae sp.]DAD51765.1 TPA_asm: maturation protein [ssRNA phage Zoerhiza.1_35]